MTILIFLLAFPWPWPHVQHGRARIPQFSTHIIVQFEKPFHTADPLHQITCEAVSIKSKGPDGKPAKWKLYTWGNDGAEFIGPSEDVADWTCRVH